MKTKNILILLLVAMVLISSCSKEEQPRFVKIEIMKRTAAKVVQAENAIDRNRATSNPSAYRELAAYWTEEVWLVVQDEMPREITKVVGEYDKFWREKSPKHQSKVWKRIDVGVDIELYRTNKAYSEVLLRMLRDYCHKIVNGGYEYVSGERIEEDEAVLLNLFVFDPDPMVDYHYKDRLYEYFLKFAHNPNEKAKYEKNGFLNFGWWQ